MATNQFLVNFNGQQSGPHSGDEIASMLAQGRIDATAVVWSDGWANWLPVGQAIPAASAQPQQQAPLQPTAQQTTAGAERCWQVQDRGSQYGPYTQVELASFVATGRVSSAAMVWQQGLPQWVPVASVVSTANAPRTMANNGMPPGYNSKRITAGIFALLLGNFGIHKFVMGYTGAGIVMLLLGTVGIFTIVGPFIVSIIAIIEAITYLTKTDEQFYQDYVVNKKSWF